MIVLLKTLDRAVADGNHVLAVTIENIALVVGVVDHVGAAERLALLPTQARGHRVGRCPRVVEGGGVADLRVAAADARLACQSTARNAGRGASGFARRLRPLQSRIQRF